MDADQDLNLDLSKKKKKPKKPFDLDELDDKQNDDQAQNDKPIDDDLEDLGDLLSKKKKKKKKAFNLDDLENALPTEEPVEKSMAETDQNQDANDADLGAALGDGDLDFNLPLKKKKKKKVVLQDLNENATTDLVENQEIADKENQQTEIPTGEAAWSNSDRDYTYDELLELVFNIIKEKNPEIAGERKKLVMRPPQVLRVGTKKSSFANFIDICKSLHRQPKHVQAFLLAELGTSGSVDANNQLIIKGRFQQKQIESVLKKYIKEYVSCQTCRSPETILQKDTRLFFLQCETCGSRRSVASIKSGFQAVTGKRAAIRAKTA